MSFALLSMKELMAAEPADGTVPTVRLEVSLGPGAALPRYATEGAAGLDLCSAESVTLAPMERRLVNTGVRVAIPPGFEGQVRARSGLALRHGLSLVNSVGTIDSDYRGEIGVILINLGMVDVAIEAGDRIAQLVVSPVVHARLEQVDTVSRDTARGEGGFGSTGPR